MINSEKEIEILEVWNGLLGHRSAKLISRFDTVTYTGQIVLVSKIYIATRDVVIIINN